jgi:serine-type D-Ala-D-Ala carboxypeptidase (penicillin-binding protein 5/6)
VTSGGPIGPLQGGQLRRRRRWPRLLAALAAVAAVAGAVATVGLPAREGGSDAPAVAGIGPPDVAPAPPAEGRKRDRGRNRAPAERFQLEPSPARTVVRHEFDRPPPAGLMFDVDTGEVLWERHPERRLPIASLTKMMTALLIAERHRPGERVRISRAAAETGGSKLGVLPRGKRVRLEPLLHGLMLVSGNDAAVALAEHDAGGVPRFVERMNRRARAMGLSCTRFSTPHGLEDAGNRSCPRDLGALARATLASKRIRKIASTDRSRLRFPIRGGFLDIANNNPLIRAGVRKVTGLKTGYTSAAGRCYVMTARRGDRHLGVVLLDSPDPVRQVRKLLKLGRRA